MTEPTPPPASRRIWPFLLAVGLAGLLCGLFIGSIVGAGIGSSTATPAPARTVYSPVPVPEATKTVAAPGPTKTVTVPGPTKTVTAPPAEEEPTDITDGQYLVGDDIKPGRYRTVDPAEDVTEVGCYADVADGEDILRQEVTQRGKTIIEVPKPKDGQVLVFTSDGCGDWERVKK